MTDLVGELLELDRGKKVVLTGYPDETESEWHVQTSVRVGEEGDSSRVVVLQATAWSDQWLTVTIGERDGKASIEEFAAAEGGPPDGEDDESAVPVDPEDVEIVDVGRASYSDRVSND